MILKKIICCKVDCIYWLIDWLSLFIFPAGSSVFNFNFKIYLCYLYLIIFTWYFANIFPHCGPLASLWNSCMFFSVLSDILPRKQRYCCSCSIGWSWFSQLQPDWCFSVPWVIFPESPKLIRKKGFGLSDPPRSVMF